MGRQSHSSSNKRRKELARSEKQKEKAAKRIQSKLQKSVSGPDDGLDTPENPDDPAASEGPETAPERG